MLMSQANYAFWVDGNRSDEQDNQTSEFIFIMHLYEFYIL